MISLLSFFIDDKLTTFMLINSGTIYSFPLTYVFIVFFSKQSVLMIIDLLVFLNVGRIYPLALFCNTM